MNIPEYYRQFQNKPPEKKETENKAAVEIVDAPVLKKSEPAPKSETVQPKQEPSPYKTVLFQGNGFTLKRKEDWEDKTIYTITGPVTDGIQHNIIISVEKDVTFDNVKDYAEWQLKSLTQELKGCTMLSKTEVKLFNGMNAVEAYYSWYPVTDIKIYQRQMFILAGTTAYKMAASFTKKTQHTVGPEVEKMMLSFDIPENRK